MARGGGGGARVARVVVRAYLYDLMRTMASAKSNREYLVFHSTLISFARRVTYLLGKCPSSSKNAKHRLNSANCASAE